MANLAGLALCRSKLHHSYGSYAVEVLVDSSNCVRFRLRMSLSLKHQCFVRRLYNEPPAQIGYEMVRSAVAAVLSVALKQLLGIRKLLRSQM